MVLEVSLLLSNHCILKCQCSGFKHAGRSQSVAGYILNHPPSTFKLCRYIDKRREKWLTLWKRPSWMTYRSSYIRETPWFIWNQTLHCFIYRSRHYSLFPFCIAVFIGASIASHLLACFLPFVPWFREISDHNLCDFCISSVRTAYFAHLTFIWPC